MKSFPATSRVSRVVLPVSVPVSDPGYAIGLSNPNCFSVPTVETCLRYREYATANSEEYGTRQLKWQLGSHAHGIRPRISVSRAIGKALRGVYDNPFKPVNPVYFKETEEDGKGDKTCSARDAACFIAAFMNLSWTNISISLTIPASSQPTTWFKIGSR